MYRGPAKQYKIRSTNPGNETGENFSITIPRQIFEQFSNVLFSISLSGTNILLTSGAKIE